MHSGLDKYFIVIRRQTILLLFMLMLATSAMSQQNKLQDLNAKKPLNPLLYSSFKKPMKPNPLFEQYVKPTRFELMYWPDYPLTAEQIAARDRRYEQSLGQQIVGDIIGSGINTLLYGRKLPPAKVPKF